MGVVLYCKFRNFGDNFIFLKSIKRHICHVKNSRQGHDLPISVNDRMILPFCQGFIHFTKIKPWRISKFTVLYDLEQNVATIFCYVMLLTSS